MSLYPTVFFAGSCRGSATRDDFAHRTHWATSEAIAVGRFKRHEDQLLCRTAPKADVNFMLPGNGNDDAVVDCPRCLEIAARLGLG